MYAKMRKWETVLRINIGMQAFNRKVQSIWSITNHSKLRSLQNRLLNLPISTNKDLKRYGIRNDDLCYYCNEPSL